MICWRGHVKVRRWRLDVKLYRPTGKRGKRWLYASGGKATPGPWWTVWVLNHAEVTLSHDRTLFGWDDQ